MKLIGKLRQRFRALLKRPAPKPRRVPMAKTPLEGVLELENMVCRLTNWQRSQWARAGYPKSVEAVEKFTQLKKVKK